MDEIKKLIKVTFKCNYGSKGTIIRGIDENKIKFGLDYLYEHNQKERNTDDYSVRVIIYVLLNNMHKPFNEFISYIVDKEDYPDYYKLLILQTYDELFKTKTNIKFICGLKNVSDDIFDIIKCADDDEFISLLNSINTTNENKNKLLIRRLSKILYDRLKITNNIIVDILIDYYVNNIIDLNDFECTICQIKLNSFLEYLINSGSNKNEKVFDKLFWNESLDYIEYDIKYLLTLKSITLKQHEHIIKKISRCKIDYDTFYDTKYYAFYALYSGCKNQIMRYLIPYIFHINFKYDIPNKLIKHIFKCLGKYNFFKPDAKKLIKKLKNKIPRNSLYQVLGTTRDINKDIKCVVDLMMETYDIKIDAELINNRNIKLVKYLIKKYPKRCRELTDEMIKRYKI